MIILKVNRVKTRTGDYNYYLADTVRKNGRSSTVNIKSLGKHSELVLKHEDPYTFLKDYAKKLTVEALLEQESFRKCTPQKPLEDTDDISKTNLKYVGHFYLNDIITRLDLKSFFRDLKKDLKIQYDPYQVIKHLIIDRIMHPKSKLQTYHHMHEYYDEPTYALQDIFKTLDLVEDHLESYQTHLYQISTSILKRDTDVLYYDCTNFYFEKNKAEGLVKYGLGKDKKGKPIVGLGLFMDGSGLPLAFNVYEGNKSEQQTVLPLERKIIKDFNLSRFIYISDAGLNSNEIRNFNAFGSRDFIVTESLRKLSEADLKPIFNDSAWYVLGDARNKPYKMEDILELEKKSLEKALTMTFYKDMIIDKPMKVGLSETTENNRTTNKTAFKQRLIITYKTKYKLKQQGIRLTQVEKAYEMIERKSYQNGKANSPKRYIEAPVNADDVNINLEMIEHDSKFDGHYALATSLMDEHVDKILKANGYRWKIEDHMKTLKLHLKTRPIHHYKDERITAHITICFTALLVVRILEHLLEQRYTTQEILNQLKTMKVMPENLSIYHSTYTGSKLLTHLDKVFSKNLSMDKFTNLQLNKNKNIQKK